MAAPQAISQFISHAILDLLASFLFTCRIWFVISQILLTLIKFIEKYSNNYTIQHMHYQRILYGGFNETNLVL